ncbi:MAG TPA: hypothetical protein VGX70_04995 [Gemmataceae bacterium]|jgi:hypothetical protein|nr:hypothetical protein [Gemmataceae bacterium]
MKRKWRWFLLALATLAVLALVYVRANWRHNQLAFMEAHTHCIKAAGLALEQYATQHQGRFPFHPKGYGNALLLLNEDYFASLTGPGYDAAPFFKAKIEGTELTEEDCGRVYIQGLTKKSNPQIVLLFDKLPTPGGDHCHFPIRLWAPLGREVWSVGEMHQFIRESEWTEFASKQVDLLVQEGFDRQDAERLFASKPK